jgi:hypothetical protein
MIVLLTSIVCEYACACACACVCVCESVDLAVTLVISGLQNFAVTLDFSGLQNLAVTLDSSGWQNLAGMPGFAAIHDEQRSTRHSHTRHQHQAPLMSEAMQRDINKILNNVDAMSMKMEANEHIGIDTLQQFNAIGHDIRDVLSKAVSAFDRMENTMQELRADSKEMKAILERSEQQRALSEQQRALSEQQRAVSDKRIEQMERRFTEHDLLAQYRYYIASFRSTIICKELNMPWHTLRRLLEEQASKRVPVVDDKQDMQQAMFDVVARRGIPEQDWDAIWRFSDLSNRSFHQSNDLLSAVQFLENRDNELFTLEYAREPLIKMLHIMIESEDDSENSSKKRKR